MSIFCAYKTELDPTRKQVATFLRHAGAARWAFNWGLQRKCESYKTWTASGRLGRLSTPSAIDLHRELVILKKTPLENGGVPWMYEVSKWAPQQALRNLDRAYAEFFRRCKGGSKHKGFPRFKSRKRGIGSFTLADRALRATETHVRLPKLGFIKLKERSYLPTSCVKILSATVSEKAGRWFVSLQVEQECELPPAPNRALGVDVGIKSLAVTSDGEAFANPKALRTAERRIRLAQKSVSRKVKGSANRRKAVHRLARQHYRVSCVRKDAIHKATSAITKRANVIVIESLNVAGMMKNHKLALAISDTGMSEFHRQLRYKAEWRGSTIIEADQFFPSSKRCSACGSVKESLSLAEREYACDLCGLTIDRDLNAAINLKNLAGSSPVSACRPESAGRNRKVAAKLLVGQEPRKDVRRTERFFTRRTKGNES